MGADRWFSISFWGCCALVAVPLWTVEYLPMADLSQHAAQIAIWTRWSDPASGYREIYQQNWFTPYLFGYLITFALTPLMSVKAAVTTVITAAVIGVPLATRFVVREVGGNRWWTFAAFPGVFGFAFGWGFFNFLVGIPVAMVLMVFALRHAARPSLGTGTALSLGMLALFFVHALLFLYVSLILGAVTVAGWGSWRRVIASLAPVLVLAPLVVFWLYVTRDTETLTHRAMAWEFIGQSKHGPRTARFFSEIVGEELSTWTFILGLLVLALPLALGGRPSRSFRRWIPFGVTVLVYFAVPHEFLGTGFLYSRFAIFAIPTWLHAMDDAATPSLVRSVLGPALAVGCTAAATIQMWAYEPEVAGLAKVIERMPDGARVLSVPIERGSMHARTPVFLHTPCWYQAERGGVVDFSFAINFPSLFRYRPEHEPKIPRTFVWNTSLFDWEGFDGALYDFLIVREMSDQPSTLIVESGAPVDFVGRVGPWQLFERTRP